jgi:hypothetical protein
MTGEDIGITFSQTIKEKHPEYSALEEAHWGQYHRNGQNGPAFGTVL